jgi:acyl-CoA reductase-like NAD-dependent aldehyde dehydrogenase
MTSAVDFSTFSNIVNGERRSSANLSRTVDPSNRELLWDVPVASKQDVNDAAAAAKEEMPSWSKIAWYERRRHFSKAWEGPFARKDE